MASGTKLSPTEPRLGDGCNVQASRFGAYVEIGAGTTIGYSEIGDYSYCDRLCDIANATVGKFSNIASCVRIGATDHPMARASLHHFMYRSARYWDDAEDDTAWFEYRRTRRTVIGHDTWLGHAAQVKPEVTVGHGAIIAAGALVTRDVAPYQIVAGVPARPIRWRQPPEIADRLIALGWWDWDHARLRAALNDFRAMDAATFLEAYGG